MRFDNISRRPGVPGTPDRVCTLVIQLEYKKP